MLLAAILGVAFLIGSFVWLDLDDSIPVYDSGMHMWLSLGIRDAFANGHLGYWFTGFNNYPPLVHVVGAVGMLIGGLNPTGADRGQPARVRPAAGGRLLHHRPARLWAWGRRNGGSVRPRLSDVGVPASLVHARRPEAALVSASVAALLSSNRFRRTRMCVLAGVLCGLD